MANARKDYLCTGIMGVMTTILNAMGVGKTIKLVHTIFIVNHVLPGVFVEIAPNKVLFPLDVTQNLVQSVGKII